MELLGTLRGLIVLWEDDTLVPACSFPAELASEVEPRKAVKMEVKGKPSLFWTEGNEEANQVFKALPMGSPTRVREF